MADVSEAAKAKVEELSGHHIDWNAYVGPFESAFARFIQEVSDAAKEASALFSAHRASATCITARNTLAPFILPEPVDPLLIEARKLACEIAPCWWPREEILAGAKDETPAIRDLTRALKRGVELGKSHA